MPLLDSLYVLGEFTLYVFGRKKKELLGFLSMNP